MVSIKNYGMKWISKKSKDTIRHDVVIDDDEVIATIKVKKIDCCNYKIETELEGYKAPFGNEKVSEKQLKSYIKEVKSYINQGIIDQEEY